MLSIWLRETREEKDGTPREERLEIGTMPKGTTKKK